MSPFFFFALLPLLLGDSSTTSQPASQPTSRPVSKALVDSLIAQLASPNFKIREGAQKQLADLGESAGPQLIPHVTDSNPEIAQRVAAILGTPRDPSLRVELAMRLLTSSDPDWMERGVYMLFESPVEVCDIFIDKTKDAPAPSGDIFAPVAEQLLAYRQVDAMFRRGYERLRKTKPDKAAQALRIHEDGKMYHAEAAYWAAYDALLDYNEQRASPTTQPSTSP